MNNSYKCTGVYIRFALLSHSILMVIHLVGRFREISCGCCMGVNC